MSPSKPEEEVTALLQRLAEHARTEPSGDMGRRVVDLRARRPSRWIGMAALLVVVAMASALVVSRDDTPRQVMVGGELPTVTGGTTERLSGSGLAERTGAASVWTGKEVLVWGGLTLAGTENRFLADGAALDPGANRWRPLPPAPIGPRFGPAAVWTGTEMVVWGGGARDGPLTDGAAFNPQTNRWRTIASQPFGGATRPAVVWTGTEMVIVGSFNAPPSASAYDPATDRWRRLPAPPGAVVMPYPQAVWTGSEAVLLLWPWAGPIGAAEPAVQPSLSTVVGGGGPVAGGAPATPPATSALSSPGTSAPASVEPPSQSPPVTPPPLPDVPPPPPGGGMGGPNSGMFLAAYSPASDQWTRLPEVALRDGGLPRLAWTGREVLALQAPDPSAAFDPATRAWRRLAPLPSDKQLTSDAVWSGRLALFWVGGNDGLAYDPRADVWRTFDAGGLRRRSDAVVVWADGVLVGWSGFNESLTGGGRLEPDGILYRPPAR